MTKTYTLDQIFAMLKTQEFADFYNRGGMHDDWMRGDDAAPKYQEVVDRLEELLPTVEKSPRESAIEQGIRELHKAPQYNSPYDVLRNQGGRNLQSDILVVMNVSPKAFMDAKIIKWMLIGLSELLYESWTKNEIKGTLKRMYQEGILERHSQNKKCYRISTN